VSASAYGQDSGNMFFSSLLLLQARFSDKTAESDGTKLKFLPYPTIEDGAMRTLKVSLIASLIGTAVGLGSWVFGLGQIIWPAHPQMACFLLTLATTIVIQITWPRLTETNSR
jgi:hypothetical protein